MALFGGTRLPNLAICLALVLSAGCCYHRQWHEPSLFSWPWDREAPPDPELFSHTAAARMQGLDTLLEELEKKDPPVQEQITIELARRIQAEANPLVRLRIIQAVSVLRTPTAEAIMQAAVKDTDPHVRIAACELWGKHRSGEATSVLRGVLAAENDVDVRLAAIRALGNSREPAAVDTLASALSDPNPAMQYRAVESLKEVTGQDLGSDVNQWRAMAETGKLQPHQPRMADQFMRIFR